MTEQFIISNNPLIRIERPGLCHSVKINVIEDLYRLKFYNERIFSLLIFLFSAISFFLFQKFCSRNFFWRSLPIVQIF
jgi:hypothetical protein